MQIKTTLTLLTVALCLEIISGYSAFQDARIINEYKRNIHDELDHAQIARKLVNQVDWASVGTISSNNVIKGYPMVNIKSINDIDAAGKSTGRIQFLLTDLDFTGIDWHNNNKVTFTFTDEQLQHCTNKNIDPMEPTCARAIISGHIRKLDQNSKYYESSMRNFIMRHPAASNWLKHHTMYLCEFDIQHIFVLDFYGGAHTVTTTDYYNAKL